MTQRFAETLLNAVAAALAGVAAVLRHPSRRFVLWAFAVVVVLVFPIAMLVISKVDDNPDFASGNATAPRSRGVAVAAALVGRELDVSKWHANDPFFMPGAWLRDMPAFQLGLVGGLSRLVGALNSEKGVAFGPNGTDVNLNHAAGLLKYPGTVWKFDTHKSWLPTASAEKQYRNAQRSLDLYNDMVAAGSASFERKPEALAAAVEALIRDLDEVTEAIDHHLADKRPVLLDFSVDGVFYGNKGRLYAYSIVLRELGRDFEKVLADRRQTEAWTRMVDQLAGAARLRPWLVWSAAPDSSFLPNHLAAQGYAALRVRMQAAEMLAALK
ncbi:DUF2333 family protein [Paramagnetospirillum magneticum]|uniref:Uncharacterized protein conserved in bacteria n=1 Tax=Paramagnetospirillum magneticum (strain ATCC 700264 / AMB-1) TaxID=342108 RepID=Q2VYW4_PARM1|nr:DUF2333 family protein [Paramagnetospirillum magneticum]BAE53211.1 Uncharacterized protein conserved in bacteria [Paramagnetospirillum magneticum AMB-1]